MIDIRQRALDTPDVPAYVMAETGEVVTRLQLEERANQCAQYLRDVGLQNGDGVAILIENNRYYLEIAHAAWRAGLVLTPISTHLTAGETEYIVNNCGAKALFTSEAMKEVAAELIDLTPNLVARVMVGSAIPGYDSYEDTVYKFPNEPIADQAAGRTMLYSSGTTGRPKGIKIASFEDVPYGDVILQAKIAIALYGLAEDTVYLSPAPLYHAAPLFFCRNVIHVGGTVVVMEKFDALNSLKLIENYKVTHSQWVPTMFIRMLKLDQEERARYDVSSMKHAIHAAAPIPVPVKEQMIEWWGQILFEVYGGSEGNGATAISSEDWLTHKGSVGKVVLGKAHVLDDDGNELPPGEIGVVYFSEGQEFEYHEDQEKTKGSRSPQGWTTLGDVGYLDEEGYLYLTDRKDNMIISGGVNIYPQEAENVLIMHPKVMDAAVLGIPHPEFGEEVKGVIQLKDINDAGPEMEQELIAYCQSKLAKLKCPKTIDFEEQLPRTPTGKLLKRLLKDRYWSGEQRI
jgi:acyl-CoA synthetase (AMP-forming)/AMP-acid ligase II